MCTATLHLVCPDQWMTSYLSMQQSPIILTEWAWHPCATHAMFSPEASGRCASPGDATIHLSFTSSDFISCMLLMGWVPFLTFLPFCQFCYPPPPLVVEIFPCTSCSSPFHLETSSTLHAQSSICTTPYCLIYFICTFLFLPDSGSLYMLHTLHVFSSSFWYQLEFMTSSLSPLWAPSTSAWPTWSLCSHQWYRREHPSFTMSPVMTRF